MDKILIKPVDTSNSVTYLILKNSEYTKQYTHLIVVQHQLAFNKCSNYHIFFKSIKTIATFNLNV